MPENALPDNERLCRELRGIPVEPRAEVWDLVQQKCRATGKKADRSDLREAVKQAEQRKTLNAYERAAKLLGVSLAVESLTPDFRRRILVELTGIAEQVTMLIASLRSKTLPGALEEETGQSEETEDEAAE